ncbi:MAG: sigma-70 family RNA polymerase sigma factor [Chitinophagaceae bacterium]|nr:sigma-70 family RNA polymerase sigma factor [Chitinophagaceae bacterium]
MADIKPGSDEEWFTQMQKGHTDAFDEIYNRYGQKLFGFFYKMLWKNKELAEDFTQDLFVKLIHKKELFNTNKSFSTWLYSIANNMCKNEYRKNSIREKFQNMKVVHKHETNPNPDLAGFKKALNDFTQSLSEEKKELYVLRFMENLTVPQIAEILDLPEGTVKSRIFYLLKELKDELKIYKGLLTYP